MNRLKNELKNEKTEKKSSKKKKEKKESKINTNFGSIKLKISNTFQNARFQQISGVSFFLISIYLLIAFTSFVFTWKTDQDKLLGSWSDLIFNPEIELDNWLGKLGAIVSHQFIHNWFGVSSFLFVMLAFLLGFKILLKTSLLPLKKTFKFSTFFIIWLSVAFGFLFQQSNLLFLGGAFGYQSNIWLATIVGRSGAGLLVLFSLAIFSILSFNISLEKIKGLFAPSSLEDDIHFDEEEIEPKKPEELNYEATIKRTVVPEVDWEESNTTNEPEIEEPFLKKDIETITTEPEPDTLSSEELEITSAVSETNNDSEVVEKSNDSDLEIETPQPEKVVESTTDEISDEDDLEMDVEDTTEVDDTLSDKEVDKKLEDFGEYDPTLDLGHYKHPIIDLLENHGDGNVQVNREELEANKNRIVETLGHYKIEIAKIKATIGPTVTLYEIVPAPGVRISKIKNLEDDIALSLAALGIRIIAPIPGKGTIGIEVPNSKPDIVSMRAAIASEKFQNSKMELPVAIGKTIQNETFVADLAKMPHLLIAGATGQGKSVGINAILTSLLYKKHPSQLKFVMVDPKMVELSIYGKIEKHFLAKLPDTDAPILTDSKKVTNTLNSLVIEMENRLKLCAAANARNIIDYNNKFIKRKLNPNNGHKILPYIVVLIDEFADFIMEAGKEIETPIARLAQKARAIGIHLIIATQRPSANVITGIIKANFPARIAFRVSSKIDSRVILDAGGADQLIGRGDMLYSGGQDLIRIQCAFVDTPEVEDIVDFIGEQQGYPETFELPEYIDENAASSSADLDAEDRDDLFEDAARVIVMHQQGSASLLQRKLKLGYNRAGRLIDQLEAAGIVGPHEGSKARQVLYPDEYSLEQFLNSESGNNETNATNSID